MFKIDKDDKTTIKVTRGDKGSIRVVKRIKTEDGTSEYEPFYAGDEVIFSLKSNFGDNDVILRKTVRVTEDTNSVTFDFSRDDTTIEDLIGAPIKYQYDISINGDMTILGYDDETGAKYLVLYPEGSSDN